MPEVRQHPGHTLGWCPLECAVSVSVMQEALRALHPRVVVLDEAHYCKDPKVRLPHSQKPPKGMPPSVP